MREFSNSTFAPMSFSLTFLFELNTLNIKLDKFKCAALQHHHFYKSTISMFILEIT